MTNSEKYRTAQKRAEAFNNFCRDKDCEHCKAASKNQTRVNKLCHWTWLDLEAEEEKPLTCPFCGLVPVSFIDDKTGNVWVACTCGYQSPEYKGESFAIAAHNRVAKAVRGSEGK